ncbi:MAG: hypothetical protein JKX79_11290 [Labilibaculum sp.]|nr:hypothetical protein [Labilibaculum sp.]
MKTETIINNQGEILFFGLEHFLEDIANGDCCFICGAKPNSKPFNDEHVIPDWILRKFNLHTKFITLPNGTRFKYGQYKVPCCKECNSSLGKYYEEPIRDLLCKPYEEILKELDDDFIRFIFKWLCLIFIKTHLKDKSLLYERDRRIDTGYISNHYPWEDMHHIHCIARSHYTGAKMDQYSFGSIIVVPTIQHESIEDFDYMDNEPAKCVMLRLGHICIIAILDDAGAGSGFFNSTLNRIKGPLTPPQLKEIFSHFCFINLNLKVRPIFRSKITNKENYEIVSEIPDLVFLFKETEQISSPGEILRKYLEQTTGYFKDNTEVLKGVEDGRMGFLFDENGDFINYLADE